jgi:hypothetical protein
MAKYKVRAGSHRAVDPTTGQERLFDAGEILEMTSEEAGKWENKFDQVVVEDDDKVVPVVAAPTGDAAPAKAAVAPVKK